VFLFLLLLKLDEAELNDNLRSLPIFGAIAAPNAVEPHINVDDDEDSKEIQDTSEEEKRTAENEQIPFNLVNIKYDEVESRNVMRLEK
jgi:hypothetical protein